MTGRNVGEQKSPVFFGRSDEGLVVCVEEPANGDAAARALGIHRHTLRARISLIERLLERDLRGFAARADLWAALQLTR